ncbi:DndE family protein [Sphingopyxis sp.]|uniref:DndE family protein n=1 Tax=Sphingopyxis sp. TaxID=1908224 RepID=UPI002B48A96B|nr:DndE family protein [Sphingopyxis sp.]HJS11617.1 DndE family protein [Sphingopyxis sp.]
MTVAKDIPVALTDIGRADFRPSLAADAHCESLQRALDLPFRYQIARMAIARSLSIPSNPPAPADAGGRSIRGETLFGTHVAELGLWLALLAEHANRADLSRRDVQELAAAHWCRGAVLLEEQWRSSGQAFESFVTRLVANRR